jgi:hypothetical protein
MPVSPEDVKWQVSSWSGGTNCVEVASNKVAIHVRDTKNRNQGILSFPATAWEDFIRAVQTDSITLR